MKFVIENISKSSGRLGHFVQSETGKLFRTPLLIQTTKSGSIPYISREVFDYITTEAPILQMSICTMHQMAESLKLFNGCVGAYVGFPDSPSILMVRESCEQMPSGGNDKDVVSLFTRRGKKTFTADKYMDLVEIFKPDIYQGLCDADTNLNSSKKRLTKCVDRTAQFMDICYDRQQNSNVLKKCSMFVPIVGGYSTFARSDSIKHAKAKDENVAGGYIFEGFHNYGLTATEVDASQLLSVMKHCLTELNIDKPKMMPGAYTPLVALELVALGVDIFDTSYAYCAASNFKALTFNFDLTKGNSATSEPFLDITAASLKEDFTPLLPNCSCIACKQHTRAYLHHLYKTKELLGPILVMLHNLHHYIHFFEIIHTSIAADKIPDLIHLIKFQGREEMVDYSIQANTKQVSKSDQRRGFTIFKDIE